jgi:hypothetical protein
MAQEVMAQETPQEQPQQAASHEAANQQATQQQPHEAANPLLEAFKILMERFKASQNGFEFSIQFSPHLFMTFEEFEDLTKGFDSINFVEMGKVTFVDLISVIAERQVEPSRCRRDQKRVTVAFRFGDDYGKTVLIDYVHGKRETVPGKCS